MNGMVPLSPEEQQELDALNGLMELLGVSEFTDEQWIRWVRLNNKLRRAQGEQQPQ